MSNTNSQRIGYARVSTDKQSLDLQLDALKAAGCIRIFTEKETGTNDNRPVLNEVLNYLRPGDTFVVYKLDRLGRSTRKLIELIEDFNSQGIEFISISDSIDTTTANGRFFFTIMAAFSQLERDLISERTKAGLDAARARGRKGGRPKLDDEKVNQALKLYDGELHTVSEITELTGVSKGTLYRRLRERKAQGTG